MFPIFSSHATTLSLAPTWITSRGFTKGGKHEFPPAQSFGSVGGSGLLEGLIEQRQCYSGEAQRNAGQNGCQDRGCNDVQSRPIGIIAQFRLFRQSAGIRPQKCPGFPHRRGNERIGRGNGPPRLLRREYHGSIPKREANYFGDMIFRKVMFAKVLCVQLVKCGTKIR